MTVRIRMLSILVLATLPLLLLAGLSLWRTVADAQAALAAERVAVARSAALTADTAISGSLITMRSVARSVTVRDPAQHADLADFLREVQAANHLWLDLGLYDPLGWSISAAQAPERVYIGDRDYFRQALSGNQPVVSSAMASRPTGERAVALVVPVDFTTGERGVLVAPLSATALGQQVSSIPLAWARVWLVDGAGQPLDAAAAAPLAPLRSEVAAALAGQTGFRRVAGAEGRDVLVSYAPVSRPGWGVLVVEPGGVMQQTLQGQIMVPLGLFLLAMLLSAGLGWYLSHWLAHNFQREQAARAEAESSQRKLAFLAEASAILSSSLDYETRLESLARLVVPALADWCAIDMVEDDDTVRRLAIVHADPECAPAVQQLQARYATLRLADSQRLEAVLRSGQAWLEPVISPETLADQSNDQEHLALLRQLGFASAMIVPLQARGRRLGAITFASGQPGRFGGDHLALAEELAGRAAIAVDNARLFREMQTAVRALASERDRLQQVLNVLPAGIAITDLDGSIVMHNAAARALWGQDDPEQHRHYAALSAYHPDGTPYAPSELPLARSLASGEVVYAEQLLIENAASGERIPVLVNSAPLREADGQINGGVTAIQDISELKQMERQKDEFMAVVSHDLKNPLAGIKAWAQMLQRRVAKLDGADAARIADGLRTIDQTASQATTMLNELLEITRYEMGRPLPLDRQPTDLVQLAQGVAKRFQHTTDQHTIRVEAAAPALIASVDRDRLERVVGNLVANAIKYSPEGGPITIIVSPADDAGHHARIQVVDRGLGIPAAERTRVFERFYRASNAMERTSGTGIGLAGARQIVEQHGGVIAVESEEGVGSIFTIEVPVEASEPVGQV